MHNRREFVIGGTLLLSSALVRAQDRTSTGTRVGGVQYIRGGPRQSAPSSPVPVFRDYRQDGSVFIKLSDESTITVTTASEKRVTRPDGVNYSEHPSNAQPPTPPQLTRDTDLAWADHVATQLLSSISKLLGNNEEGKKRYLNAESGASHSKRIEMRANLISRLTETL